MTFYTWPSIRLDTVTCIQYNSDYTYFLDEKINVLRKVIQVIQDRTETQVVMLAFSPVFWFYLPLFIKHFPTSFAKTLLDEI